MSERVSSNLEEIRIYSSKTEVYQDELVKVKVEETRWDYRLVGVDYEDDYKNFLETDSWIVINNFVVTTPGGMVKMDELLASCWQFIDAGRCTDDFFGRPRAARKTFTVSIPITPSVWRANADQWGAYLFPGILGDGMRFGTLHEIDHALRYSKMGEDEYRERSRLDDEQAAWNGALKIMRDLRSGGVDLEPRMTDRELVSFANKYLATHE